MVRIQSVCGRKGTERAAVKLNIDIIFAEHMSGPAARLYGSIFDDDVYDQKVVLLVPCQGMAEELRNAPRAVQDFP